MRHSGSPKLLEAVLSETIPMYGRMIHSQDSTGSPTEESQQYDIHGRFIRAVDRANLNKLLLDELDSLPNVNMYFHHKLTGTDFKDRKAWFEHKPKAPQIADGAQEAQNKESPRPQEQEVPFDLILGCDGAHSSVRYHLMKYVRMDYSQSYIDTLWCEFTIPPTTPSSKSSASAREGFATSPNHLHIWPSADSMFIAIPSTDKSFTCTLFAPASDFSHLESSNSNTLLSYFNTNFPGAADLLGPSELQSQFAQNPHLPLINIKCTPHTFSSSAAILGDSAHAMVPFYGQGMNAGLEDVYVLFQHLDAHPASQRAEALDSYSAERVPDAHTINDLASDNYWEMHAGVTNPVYKLRKTVEEFISDKFPSTGFATQYSRVSFSNQRYSEVRKAVERQGRILVRGMVGLALSPAVAWAAWWVWRWRRATGTGRMAVKGGAIAGLGLGSVAERLGRIFT